MECLLKKEGASIKLQSSVCSSLRAEDQNVVTNDTGDGVRQWLRGNISLNTASVQLI